MKIESKKKAITILRWIFFIPISFLGGVLAYNAGWFINSISLEMAYVNVDGFIGQTYLHFFSSMCLGWATVYIASYLVPTHKIIVAIIVAGAILFFSGALIFSSLMKPDYWAVFESIVINIGAIATAYSIYKGEVIFKH